MSRINSNYRFVIGFNGSLIGLGVAGVLAPATSAMLHNLSTLVILRRLMPSVDKLCIIAEVAGASTPATPRPISEPLKPITKR